MKLLYISTYPSKGKKHSSASGVSSYAKNLITNLPPKKSDKIYVLCEKNNGIYEKYIENNIEVRRCFNKSPRFIFQLIKEIKEINPDVIHIQQELSLYGGVITAYLLQWLILYLNLRKYNVVLTLHGVISLKKIDGKFIEENYSSLPVWIVKLAFKMIYRPLGRADKVIVHEDFFRSILLSEYRYDSNKVVTIYHGVENIEIQTKEFAREKLNISKSSYTILFMGYATGYKGIDILIEGFKEYLKINNDAFLLLGAGEHPKLKNDITYQKEYLRLQNKAEQLIPKSNYKWVGFINENDIPLYYAASDVSVYPYTIQMSSSGPMAIAMGTGRPYIASTAFNHSFKRFSQVLFESNADALAIKLNEVEKNISSYEEVAKTMKEERLWEVVSRMTYDLYAPKSKGKVLLLGSYGQTNLGDDILMYNYVSLLKNTGYSEIYTNANVISNVPEELQKDIHIFETYRTPFLKWLKIIWNVDVIFYGGGTIYKELYKAVGRNRYSVIFRITCINFCAKLMQKKVINLNIGIGVVNTKIGKLITKFGLIFSDFTVFRDKQSYTFALETLSIPQNKIFLGNDGIFLNQRWHSQRNSQRNKPITIGFNVLSDIPDWIDRNKYISEICLFLDYLLKREYKIVFFPFQHSFNKHNDLDFIEKEILPNIKWKTSDKLKAIRLNELISEYHKIDLFVGMRFHSLLLCLSTATPFLAIEYDTKCTRFVNEINYHQTIKLEDINHLELIKKLDNLEKNYETISKVLSEISEEYYDRDAAHHKVLYKLISDL